MQACVFSGQTRFIQGMQAKFRCNIFANSFSQGEVSLNFVGPKRAIVGTLKAAATCIGPLSFVTKIPFLLSPAMRSQSSLTLVLPAKFWQATPFSFKICSIFSQISCSPLPPKMTISNSSLSFIAACAKYSGDHIFSLPWLAAGCRASVFVTKI